MDLSWEAKYVPIHGIRTSGIEGYKLGSMMGSDQQFHIAIFFSKQKRLIPPPIVTVAWETEPTGEEIVTRLTAAIDVGQLHHHNRFRTDGMRMLLHLRCCNTP